MVPCNMETAALRRRLARTWRSLTGALFVLLGFALPSIALAEESAPAYAIKERGRIWFGETITLTRAGCADKAAPAPIVELLIASKGEPETLTVGATDVKDDISSDVLSLLGIGSATAVFSRAASSARTYIPRRYLALVRDPDRVPRLSDLLTVDGAPNVFKLQMLVFTLVTAGIVVKEVIEKCAFPALPPPMIALMGMSSLTYLGSEVLPRDLFVDIKDRISKIEDLAKTNTLPVSSKADLETLERDSRFTGMIAELREALAEVYGGEARSPAEYEEKPGPAISAPPSSEAPVAPPSPPSHVLPA